MVKQLGAFFSKGFRGLSMYLHPYFGGMPMHNSSNEAKDEKGEEEKKEVKPAFNYWGFGGNDEETNMKIIAKLPPFLRVKLQELKTHLEKNEPKAFKKIGGQIDTFYRANPKETMALLIQVLTMRDPKEMKKILDLAQFTETSTDRSIKATIRQLELWKEKIDKYFTDPGPNGEPSIQARTLQERNEALKKYRSQKSTIKFLDKKGI